MSIVLFVTLFVVVAAAVVVEVDVTSYEMKLHFFVTKTQRQNKVFELHQRHQ